MKKNERNGFTAVERSLPPQAGAREAGTLAMKNQEIARIFSEIADVLELKQENVFKIRAYRRGAMSLDDLPKDVTELSRKELRQVPGIGADLAARIEEYLQTGKIEAYEQLRGDLPPGLRTLLAVPGLGPKTARTLYDKLGVASLDELERLAAEHKLVGIRGIQQKTEENILKGIGSVKRGRERQPLGKVLPLARDLVEQLKRSAPVERIELAGSLRRWKETVKDIDIVATSASPGAVMEAFLALPRVEEVILRGPTRSSVLLGDGIQMDLRVVEKGSFGAALAYLTGSKNHNVRLRALAVKMGLKVNEYGIFREKDGVQLGGAEEEDVYRLLGLPYIPPELREDQGEVEAAFAGTLPELIRREDLRGDLHVHSRWSDGAHHIDEVVDAARAEGFSYFGLTDHSQALAMTRGLNVERLMEQKREVAEINSRLRGFTILHGTEMDIRPDGTLDFPDEALKELDFVIAAVHSAFRQSREQLTARITAAMRNPYVTMIAHPTGRIIGEREAYDVDMEEILRVAAETGTALEINAYPLRLDLNDLHCRRARELGVPIAINSDAHLTAQFATLPYGVAVGRRSWLEKNDVLNTLDLAELKPRLRDKQRRKSA